MKGFQTRNILRSILPSFFMSESRYTKCTNVRWDDWNDPRSNWRWSEETKNSTSNSTTEVSCSMCHLWSWTNEWIMCFYYCIKKYPDMITKLLHGIHLENKDDMKLRLAKEKYQSTQELKDSEKNQKQKDRAKKKYDDTRSACACVWFWTNENCKRWNSNNARSLQLKKSKNHVT